MTNLLAAALILDQISTHLHDLGKLYEDLAAVMDPLRPVDIDVLTLARAIQGEEAGRFGDRREELGEWIAHTAWNRWEQPWWWTIDGEPCTFVQRVEKDWHGTRLVERPEPWAVAIAHRVLEEHRQGNREDKAQGALFAMTIADLTAHGWMERAKQVRVHTVPALDITSDQADFWFMTTDPAEPHKEK
jgi:hypothetical protein